MNTENENKEKRFVAPLWGRSITQVNYQIHEESKNEIRELLSDEPREAVNVFLQGLEIEIGRFVILKKGLDSRWPGNELRKELIRWKSKLQKFGVDLEKILKNEDLAFLLSCAMPRPTEEEIIADINKHGYRTLPAASLKDLIHEAQTRLQVLEDLMSQAQLIRPAKTKGGRPRDDWKINFVQRMAGLYQQQLKIKPTAYEDGPFESIVRIAFDLTGWKKGNIHSLVLKELKK